MTDTLTGSPALDAIRAALATVQDPEINRPLPELGMVKDVQIGVGGDPGWAKGMTGSAASVPRTVLRSSARCSSLITSRTTDTEVTPATADTAWVTRLVMVSRIGQPETVR
ncbi:MAG: iron-sulfur cluster assembly protein [Actinomycetes bacterium]